MATWEVNVENYITVVVDGTPDLIAYYTLASESVYTQILTPFTQDENRYTLAHTFSVEGIYNIKVMDLNHNMDTLHGKIEVVQNRAAEVWAYSDRVVTGLAAGAEASGLTTEEHDQLMSLVNTTSVTAPEIWGYAARSLTNAVNITTLSKEDIAGLVWSDTDRTLTEAPGLTIEQDAKLMGLTNYDDSLLQTKVDEVTTNLDSIAVNVDRLLDYNEGNWKIISNQMIYYDRNGVEFLRFDLLDSAGQPISRGAMQRVAV